MKKLKITLIGLIILMTLTACTSTATGTPNIVVENNQEPQEETVVIDIASTDVKEDLRELAEKYNMKFFKEVTDLVEEDRYVLVFETKYCEACRAYLPTLLEYINTPDTEDLYIVNLDDEATHKLAEQFNITQTPTTIIIENGEEVHRTEGLLTIEELVEKTK